jgi:hypothetical protein
MLAALNAEQGWGQRTAVCGLAGITPTVMAFQGSGPRPMCWSAVLIMPVACFTCPAAAVFTAGILPGAASAAVTSTCAGSRRNGVRTNRMAAVRALSSAVYNGMGAKQYSGVQ